MVVALIVGSGELAEAAAAAVISRSKRVVQYGEKADVLINCMGTRLIPQQMLDFYGGRCFNLHNGKLPEYKGRNALSHGIIDGRPTHTVTIHWMVEELDAGDIAFERTIPILENDTAYSLYLRCIPEAVALVHTLMDGLELRAFTKDVHQLGMVPRRKQRGIGIVHDKDSLDVFRNIPHGMSQAYMAMVSRALDFPEKEPPYFVVDGFKYYVTPGGAA